MKTDMGMNIGIYLFPDVEVLDFAGPYEVFTTAERVFRRRQAGDASLFRVFTLSATNDLVRVRAGLQVKPDFTCDRHPAIDVLIVPGGVVTEELKNPATARWIGEVSADAQLTASVCTGAFLLARAGLLAGQSVTTHWEDIATLREMFPDLDVVDQQRWIDRGRIVTSAGISAGIDMSLHLVARLAGRELAMATARQMEVDWRENAPCVTEPSPPAT